MTTTTTAASRSHVEKGWSVAFAPCQNIPQVPLRPLLARKKTPMAWPSRHDVTECRVASTRGEGSRPESSVAAALLIAHKNFPRSLPTGFVGPRAKSCPSLLNFPPLSLGRDDLGSIHLYSKPTDSAPFIVCVSASGSRAAVAATTSKQSKGSRAKPSYAAATTSTTAFFFVVVVIVSFVFWQAPSGQFHCRRRE